MVRRWSGGDQEVISGQEVVGGKRDRAIVGAKAKSFKKAMKVKVLSGNKGQNRLLFEERWL